MAITYEPITTQTLTSAATVSFTSIPSSYTDLFIVLNGTTNGAIFSLQYNGDTAANYSSTQFWGGSSSPATSRYGTAWIYVIPGGTGTDYFSVLLNIQDYANTTTYKTSLARAGVVDANTNASVQLWRSTAAINRVDIIFSGAGVMTGTATLFGIKAA